MPHSPDMHSPLYVTTPHPNQFVICSLGSGTIPAGGRWTRLQEYIWFPEINGTSAFVKYIWGQKAIASVKFPLEAYNGVVDANGGEVIPQLRIPIAQGVQYPVLHLTPPDGRRTDDRVRGVGSVYIGCGGCWSYG